MCQRKKVMLSYKLSQAYRHSPLRLCFITITIFYINKNRFFFVQFFFSIYKMLVRRTIPFCRVVPLFATHILLYALYNLTFLPDNMSFCKIFIVVVVVVVHSLARYTVCSVCFKTQSPWFASSVSFASSSLRTINNVISSQSSYI